MPSEKSMQEARDILELLADELFMLDSEQIEMLATNISQALDRREAETRDEICKQIEFCGFGSMGWRMQLINKIRSTGKEK